MSRINSHSTAYFDAPGFYLGALAGMEWVKHNHVVGDGATP
jgi:hypothetical protein